SRFHLQFSHLLRPPEFHPGSRAAPCCTRILWLNISMLASHIPPVFTFQYLPFAERFCPVSMCRPTDFYTRLLLLIRLDFTDFFCADFPADAVNEFCQGFLALITQVAASDRNHPVFFLFGSHNQHIGNSCQAGFADLVTDFFRTIVHTG